MRGKADPQAVLFTAAIDLETRVRPDHPLRAIKRMADEDLAKMGRRFDAAYCDDGRPSVPPERLIKALLLQALYTIRSEAQLVERIDHDLLFRWFLDLRIDRGGLRRHGVQPQPRAASDARADRRVLRPHRASRDHGRAGQP